MEDYRKDFPNFREIVDPIIKIEILHGNSESFGLGYRSINTDEKEFIVKFKIVFLKNRVESIKIIHGYYFKVQDKLIIGQNVRKLAHFFAFLVTESLIKVNCSLPEGEIEIPAHESLTDVVFQILISRLNG